MADQLKITQVRSGIGTKPKHRGTLRALGLGRIGRTRTHADRPEISVRRRPPDQGPMATQLTYMPQAAGGFTGVDDQGWLATKTLNPVAVGE